MKIHKKIAIGLIFFVTALASLAILMPGKTLAYKGLFASGAWSNASYTMNNKAQIVITFKQDNSNDTHDSVTFADSVPTDTTFNYTVDPSDPSAPDICSGSIDLTGTSPFDQRPNIKGSIHIKYHGESGGVCPGSINHYDNDSISITNNLSTGGAPADTGTTTITYSGQTYKQMDQGVNAVVYGITTNVSDCYGKSLLVLDKVNSSVNSPVKGTLLTLKTFASGSSQNIYTYLPNLPQGFPMSSQVGGCGYDASGSDSVVAVSGQGVATFDSCPTWDPKCQAPAATTPTTGGPATSQGSDVACYQSGWALSWLACPVITAAQTTANGMYGFVEDQLKFRVPEDIGGPKGGAENAWSNLRVLVSGLVVILMLVMVISQAVGGGPFDAYTIKKMLPKLVIGVIIIQLSWPIFSWVINVVDDIGVGLADILYAPFGGSDALNLNSVMGHFVTEGAVFSWVGIPALVVFGVVAPFVVLGLILSVLVAIFMGFLALLFRKILIILCLILAPLALIAWIVPGTDRYWKIWRDNFIKALMMFPLVIALIAAGRIFAKVGSGQGGDFVGFFIVLIGFFGPLFLLPKTFKWGGTAMAAAGNGLAKVQTAALKKPKEFLGERQKGYSEERTRQSRERYLRGEGAGLNRNWRQSFGVPSLWRRPIDLIKAGQVDPTLWGRRKEAAMRRYRAAGAESEEADIKAADQEFGLLASQSADHDKFARLVGGAQIGQEVKWTDRFGREQRMEVTRDMKRAGMNGMAKFGTDRTFRELGRIMNELNHSLDAEDQIMAERFRDANVGSLKPRMDYLYRGASRVPGGSDEMPDWAADDRGVIDLRGPLVSRVGSLTPEAFASMEAPELEAILAGLSQVANHHHDAAARAVAEDRLRTIYTHYEGALNNDQIRRAMGSSLNQAMKAHLDGTNIAGINNARRDARLTTRIEQVPAIAPAGIAARIRTDGTVT